jgi:hypothetical protein
VAPDAWKAGVHSKMLGVTPGYAYQNRDEIDKQMRERAGDYDSPDLDPTIMNDIKVGLEGSIFGLHHRGKLPDQVQNPGMIDKFVSGLSEMAADIPFYAVGGVAGGLAGGAAGSEVPVFGNITGAVLGAGAGSFAVPAAVREALVLGIKNGEVKSFPDLLHRAADVTWAATKGAVTGAATTLAGGIPVGSLIAKSGVASIAVKGLYQASALTTSADLLEGKLPTANDFASNAALIIPLNLITHGMAMKTGDAKQALMDTYAKDGTTPQETAAKLNAQPPVKPDAPPGLRPAILGEQFIDGEPNESHAQLSERVLGQKPVTMSDLEADPALADKVLQTPEIHEQSVIDVAWALKDEAMQSGKAAQGEPPTIAELYNRGEMKSGRGFVTPDGKFLSRSQAKSWMKENEPDTAQMWENVAGGKNAEFHSGEYQEARQRVAGRNVAEGEPDYKGMSPELAKFLGINREGLNKIKSGEEGSDYGDSAVRTLLVGPRNMLRAEAEQVASRLRKLVPEAQDQEAISFMRDYRDDPDKLRSEIQEIQSGTNEKLKAFIPSMERALNPSPEMMQADAELTRYFGKALDLGKQVGTLDSTVDPSRYSPRFFAKSMEEGERGIGSPKFTEKTAHAIKREYLRILDPLKSGDITARTFNAFDELGVYGDRHATSISTKLFVTELKNSELGKWGSGSSIPEGWRELAPDQRGFRQTIMTKNPETGKMESFSRGLYVPKSIADAMAPMLRSGGLGSEVAGFLHAQQFTKALELGLSAFHMKAMTITAMSNMTLDGYLEAMHSDNSSPKFEAQERNGALYGLETTKTGPQYEAYQGLRQSSLPKGLSLDTIRNIPVIKQVDAFAQGITRATFDVIQRKFKVADFSSKEAAWIAKHPQATELEYGTAMRGIAKEVNAAYGGLNWDVMGKSKSFRDVSRLFLLAPDWTFSNVVNAKYAFQGGAAGPAARAFWVKSFTTGFAMTAAASIMIGGKYDPADIRHIDQVYLGKDKDGKEMYANWFFAGAPKDLMTWTKKSISDTPLAGTAEFIVNKAAPMVGTIGHMAMNEDYGSKPIYKKTDNFGKKLKDESEYAASRLAPISGVSAVEDVKKALTDPTHEWSYKDLLSLAADAIGSQTIHESPKGGTAAPKLPGAPKGRSGAYHLPGLRKP